MNETATTTPPLVHALRRSLPGRLRAVGIHLSISLVIFAVALYLILVEWYPDFHFQVDGGWQGVRIMAAVDLVLGPALTLIIFNPAKARRLIVFDLSCIGVLQLGALIWGFYAIHSKVPVMITAEDGVFHSAPAAPLQLENYPVEKLAELSDRRPALIYIRPPVTDEEFLRAGTNEMTGYINTWEDPYFFQPFAPNWPAVAAKALAADKLPRDRRFNAGLEEFLARHGGTAADYRFFPYRGTYGSCTVVFDAGGRLLDALACEEL